MVITELMYIWNQNPEMGKGPVGRWGGQSHFYGGGIVRGKKKIFIIFFPFYEILANFFCNFYNFVVPI